MYLAKNKFVESKINNKILKVIVYVLLVLLLYGVNNTSLFNSSLKPFGIGVVFALVFFGFNGFILGGVNFITQLITRLSWLGLIECVNVLCVLVVLQLLIDYKRIRLSKWYVFIFSILSQIVFVARNIIDVQSALSTFVSVVLSEFFLYSCMCFGESLFERTSIKSINLDEKICGSIVLIIFSIGISGVNVGIINFGLLFLTLLMLICVFLCNSGMSLVISVLCGIGYSIVYLNPVLISLFVVMALGAIAFKCSLKFLSGIALLIAYVAFSIFFGFGFSLGGVLSVAIGCFVYILIPKKVLVETLSLFDDKSQYLIKNVIDRNKECVVNRLVELSRVFNNMNVVYRDMVRGKLSKDSAESLLKEELISQVCKKCGNYNLCFRLDNSYMNSCIDKLVSYTFEKGKALLIDIPEYMSTGCINIALIISVLNNLMSAYNEYSATISNLDSSRILIAEQLEGVSRLLKVLADEVNANITFDSKYASLIKENLSYKGIVCYECIIYEKDINVKNILLIVKNKENIDNIIEKVVNKTMLRKYKIISISPSEVSGAVCINMTTRPNYDIAFGSSVATKGGKMMSGDNHAFIRIDEGKYMLSLSDGMGSGNKAGTVSSLTISLVENFYKAGFDNDIILSSVNKLLGLNEQEEFSTIDLSIIDGRRNTYDFIKLGACSTFLKRDSGEIEVIESSGLPVGVLENIKPHITKKLVSNMDMVIMLSDGVSDVLGDNIVDIIRNEDAINPQVLSDTILEHALRVGGGVASDDMTVICARVFESV